MGAAAILQVVSDSETGRESTQPDVDCDFDHLGSASTSTSSADSDVDEEVGLDFFGSTMPRTSRGLQRSVEVTSGFSKRTYGVNLASYESNSVTDHMRKCASQLDEQLDGLRALLPHSARGSGRNDPSVVMDAYRYIVTLQQEVENLNAEVLECEEEYSRDQEQSYKSNHNKMSDQQPLVEVMKRDGVIEVRIVCANRPGLLVDVMQAIESKGLTVTQARIACHTDNFVFKYLSLKNEESATILLSTVLGESDSDQADGNEEIVDSVKAMLMDAICEGSSDTR